MSTFLLFQAAFPEALKYQQLLLTHLNANPPAANSSCHSVFNNENEELGTNISKEK